MYSHTLIFIPLDSFLLNWSQIIDHVKLIKERNEELRVQGLAPLKKSAWESFLIGYKALNPNSEVKVIQNAVLPLYFT
jgi:hypothetical protein